MGRSVGWGKSRFRCTAMRPFHRLPPVRAGDQQGRPEAGERGEVVAAEGHTDRDGPHRLGAQQQAGPAGGGALHGPGLGQEGEHTAEQGEIDQLGPGRRVRVDQRRQVVGGGRQEQDRADEGLHRRQLQRADRPAGGEAADQCDMHGPDQRGAEHQQIAEARRVKAVAGHQQPDRQDAHAGRGEEGPGQRAAAAAAVEERGEDDGQADDEAGVGGAGVGDAVRLHDQDRRLGQAQGHTGPQLVTRPPARPAPPGRDHAETGERGEGVAGEQHQQDGERGRGRLGGQIAGTPDERDKEEYRIGTADVGHPPTVHRKHP